MEFKNRIIQKWSIAFRIMPLLVFVAVLKFVSHRFGFEVMEINALFTSLVGGTIFLIGFLISGVLSDYKECEKIPGELASSLRTLWGDIHSISTRHKSQAGDQFLLYQRTFMKLMFDWFYKRERTKTILHTINSMNDYFMQLDEEGVQVNYIIKMKNEQNNIQRLILRVDTIRDTAFVGSAYAIAEAMGILTVLGLLIIKIEPFFVSLFLSLLITFLISYMILLIRDLDNPFEYSVKGESGQEISLKSLRDLQAGLDDFPKKDKSGKQ